MLALGDLCSRLRPLGAKGEGGNALAVGTGEDMSGQACEETAAAGAGGACRSHTAGASLHEERPSAGMLC